MNAPAQYAPETTQLNSTSCDCAVGIASLAGQQFDSAQAALALLDLPVMHRTVKRLNRLKVRMKEIDAQVITEVILDDPLMTLRLLADVTGSDARRGSIKTVTGAILMMGVEPFFGRYTDLPIAETGMADHPEARVEFRRLVRLSGRAARLAGAFSVPCNDPDVGVLYLAGLLHAVARLVLCIHQPALAVSLRLQPCSPAIGAQVLRQRGLPEQFSTLVAGDSERLNPQMRRVQLAVQIASALESGWSSHAMAPLLAQLQALIGLSAARAREVVRDVRI